MRLEKSTAIFLGREKGECKFWLVCLSGGAWKTAKFGILCCSGVLYILKQNLSHSFGRNITTMHALRL